LLAFKDFPPTKKPPHTSATATETRVALEDGLLALEDGLIALKSGLLALD